MFRGIAEVIIDSKSRIAIPTRYRDQVQQCCGGNVVLTVDITESCLAIYPLAYWEAIAPQLDALSTTDRQSAMVKRLILGNATDLGWDNNFRLTIPKKHRQHAQLDKQAVLIGQGNKFELWNSDLWEQRCREWSQQLADSATEQSDTLRGISL